MSTNLPVQSGGAPLPARGGDPAVPAPERSEIASHAGTLSLADKAAVILAALGPESAPFVLQGAAESTIRRFASAMSGLWRISPEMLEQTVLEFTEELGARQQVRGGPAEARRILRQLLDDDSVSRIMDDVDMAGGRTLWEKLSNTSDQALAGFLRHEHPQTCAVVLSKMRSDKAARILERLEPDFAQIVVLRLARVPRLDIEVMQLLTDVIQREFLSVIQREQATRRPADIIGSMMNNVSTDARARLLEQLEAEQPKLALQVQKIMFTFSDLATRVMPRDAGLLMKGVEESVMLMALKMGESNAPRVVDFFLNNISKRLAKRIEGELEAHPPFTPREGEAAQQEVVNAAREMAKAGELTLLDTDEDD